jgi:glycosyltransferase involved in cell wall biosynthesis
MPYQKFLSILIPTYNRSFELSKNLDLIISIVTGNIYKDEIEILISDNHSTDNTLQLLDSTDFKDLDHSIFHQQENMGPIFNCLYLLKNATGRYFMYIGDDDYLDKEYLNTILPELKKDDQIYSVIPATMSLYSSGEIKPGRDTGRKSRLYNEGFRNCLENSWRGTQLSATIHYREGLYELYKSQKVDNLYPYVFFIACNSLRGKTWHMTEYPVTITQMDASAMRLDYGSANLIPEIFDNYKKLPGISYYQRAMMEKKLLDLQPSRYLEYLKLKGIPGLAGCMMTLFRDKSTTTLTKILLPYIVLRALVVRISKELLKFIKRI